MMGVRARLFFPNSFLLARFKTENTIVCTVFANNQQGNLALIVQMNA